MADRVDFRQALDARQSLSDFFESDMGLELAISFAKQGRPEGYWSPNQTLNYIASLRSLLYSGAVHYVTPEVCATLDEHARLLPPAEVLKKSSFLHPEAFYFFATPWHAETTPFGRVDYQRVSVLTWAAGVIVNSYGLQRGGQQQSVFESHDWAYGYPIEPGWSPDEETRGRDRFLRQRLLALALFERQTLTVAGREQPDRTTRRQWAREQPDLALPEFRVIRLRRAVPVRPTESSIVEGDLRHHRRHWVQPFWRNQFYPSEDEHHLKLVIGHYRGEGGEDVTTDKVYVVER